MPHVGVEALTIGAEIVLALQTVVARKLAPDAGAVLSVTEFITDGQRNVLPGTVTLRGDLRTRAPADCIAAERFIGQIIQGIASAHGAEATLTFKTEFVETFNAESPVQTVVAAARALGLPTLSNRPPMSFSEDFAHFAARKPGCFFLLGNGTQGPHGQPLHSSDYDFNDDLIAIGARLWARIVRDRMSS
jgi:Metal-dependent amidase/aminoacylase/carboxypeptidase